MVLAVLEARCGVAVGANDVYLNVAGGLRIGEPAADLAVAVAVVSSLADEPVPTDMVVFGEIGLGGEVRPVSQREARLRDGRARYTVRRNDDLEIANVRIRCREQHALVTGDSRENEPLGTHVLEQE